MKYCNPVLAWVRAESAADQWTPGLSKDYRLSIISGLQCLFSSGTTWFLASYRLLTRFHPTICNNIHQRPSNKKWNGHTHSQGCRGTPCHPVLVEPRAESISLKRRSCSSVVRTLNPRNRVYTSAGGKPL